MVSESEEPMLFKHLHRFDAKRNSILQRAGLPTEHVYFPLSGMISFLTVMQDGQAIETSAVGYDNAAGCNTALSGRNSNCQLIVQIAMRSLRIEKQAFCRAYHESRAVQHIVQVSNELLIEQAQQTAACHALHTAEQRLARWLLQCHDYAGDTALDLTQDFVSEMLGVQRTTVSLVAHKLQAEHLIQYRRGHVKVLDRQALEKRSCECYAAVMHSRPDRAVKPVAVPPGSGREPSFAVS